jgi:hypothetical protein
MSSADLVPGAKTRFCRAEILCLSRFQRSENMVIFGMVNRLLPPVLTRSRIWIACSVAVVADALQFLLGPLGWAGIDEAIDVVVMALQALTIGFHPLFLPTFVVEFLPGLDMFPTWTACTLAVIALRRKQNIPPPSARPPPPPHPSEKIIDI